MGISIDKLQFDPSAPTQNQRVGSFLIGSGGTVISETGSSLNVNVTNSLTISATDLDIRDLVFATDKVDVSGSEVSLDAATLAALENITVSATDLDIRDLVYTQDSITAHQGGTWIIDSITNAVNVSATNLDIRDLSHSQDSIKIGDGTNFLAVNGDGSINVNADISVVNGHEKAEDAVHADGDIGSYVLNVRSDIPSAASSASGDYASFLSDNKGRLWVNDAANAGQAYGALSVTSTAAEFLGSPLAGRKLLLLQNLGSQDVFIGFDNSVTSLNGLQLAKYSSIELPFGDNLDVYMVTASGTADVRYIQLA